MKKLWLDDVRPAPSDGGDWVHVKTAFEAIQALNTGHFDEVSLDHDLGEPADEVGNGYEVACWIEENAFFERLGRLKWRVHSANPVGITAMTSALNNADNF